ncbi:PhzF family phenazine biosynthesis protein [Rubrobacter marinus]|uniref:PhzF family phenazine biosynthesis protein n=1 Tax=Rubrobacter marinus TaxID=2653852 RepID=A0A6G8PVG0_9ACTN|nr:PhzF family phenazine biosynthesis protein [Rubrobacter marinus]QIN78192.1 PhzF family phenazine biosynthesis protein [Rubrobacter marinus]
MPNLHVLKVFVGEDGSGGNPLGVFLDGPTVPQSARQAVATRLGFSETVFVDDAEGGKLRIFTPTAELPFAGHPLVGTAWTLLREGYEVPALRPPAGEVAVRVEGASVFVTGRPEWSPPFELLKLPSPAEVDSLDGPPEGKELVGAWAWEDEAEGRVRVRVFVSELGIVEDEATGSFAARLCAALGRTISIRQGRGSRIHARPLADGAVEFGGRVEPVEVREEEV